MFCGGDTLSTPILVEDENGGYTTVVASLSNAEFLEDAVRENEYQFDVHSVGENVVFSDFAEDGIPPFDLSSEEDLAAKKKLILHRGKTVSVPVRFTIHGAEDPLTQKLIDKL